MSEFVPSETRESVDWDAEQNYVLWDYYCDKIESDGLSWQEARDLYLADLAINSVPQGGRDA